MSASSTLWLISAHARKRGGNSPGRMLAQVEVTAKIPPRQRRKNKKEVLAVEKSGKEAPAKQTQAGGSGKEPAPVAAADKQDGSDKQYCKIHRTKGHDLSNCKRVEYLVEQQKAEYERRDKEKAQGGGGEPSKK